MWNRSDWVRKKPKYIGIIFLIWFFYRRRCDGTKSKIFRKKEET